MMRPLSMCMALVIAVAVSQAADRAAVRIAVSDKRSLQESLLTLAQERLQPTGLFLDRERAWMSLSEPLPPVNAVEVRPLWAEGKTPSLPLAFEVRPVGAGNAPVRATLAVPLQREVWTATRRLRKGSSVACADLNLQRRDIRDVPKHSLPQLCEVAAGAVALRDIAAGDVLRSTDIGKAPDVMAGTPVSVSVINKGINVTTTAIALADAQVGDQIDVRLQRPTRTLRTRVIGPAAVQLMEPTL